MIQNRSLCLAKHLPDRTTEQLSISIKAHKHAQTDFVTWYIFNSHPSKHKLYIVISNEAQAYFKESYHLFEIDLETNTAKHLMKFSFKPERIMSQDERLIISQYDDVYVFCLKTNQVERHPAVNSNMDLKDTFVKRFNNGTEKLFACCVGENRQPPKLYSFDIINMKWNINNTHEFESNPRIYVHDLPNDDICVTRVDEPTAYHFSFRSNKWTIINSSSALKQVFLLPNSQITCFQFRSSHKFMFQERMDTTRNEKLFGQCDSLPICLTNNVFFGDDCMRGFPNGYTQIKQYFCGLEPTVQTPAQLWDLLRFAVFCADSNMILCCLKLLDQLCAFNTFECVPFIASCFCLLVTIKRTQEVNKTIMSIIKKHSSIEDVSNQIDENKNEKAAREMFIMSMFVYTNGTMTEPLHPKIGFDKKLTNLMGHPSCDLLVVAGLVSVPIHSFVFKMNSAYYEGLESFHSGNLSIVDLSEVIDHDLLPSLVHLMYDPTICKTCDTNQLIRLMYAADVLCCETISEAVFEELVRKMSIESIPSITNLCEYIQEKHAAVLWKCCEVILQTTTQNNFLWTIAHESMKTK
jgi:hypothetical protein